MIPMTGRRGGKTLPGALAPRAGRAYRRRAAVAAISAAAAAAALSVPVCRGPTGAPPPEQQSQAEDPGRREQGTPHGDGAKGSIGFPLVRLVPSGAAAFVSIPDVPRLVERVSGTGLARALREKEVERFASHVVENLPPGLVHLQRICVGFAKGLAPALGGELAAAVLRFDPLSRRVEAVLLADVSGREDEARAFLAGLGSLVLAGGVIERKPIAGSEALVLRTPRGTELAAWSVGDGLLAIATGSRALAAVLARRPGALEGGEPGLDQSPLFRASTDRSSLEGGTDYRLFVNVEKTLDGIFGRSAAAIRVKYGVGGLRAAALAGRVADSVREALYLDDGGSSGRGCALLWMFRGPGVDLDAARRLPAGTMMAAFGHLDGRARAREVSRAGAEVAGLLPQPLAGLVASAAGAPLTRAAGAVKGEAAVAMWNAGRMGWFPAAAVVAETPERAGAEAGLRRLWASLASGLGGRLQVHSVRREAEPARAIDLYFVENPGILIPVIGSPAYVFDGRTLIVATTATTAREIVEESGGVASTAGFRAVLADLPERRSGLAYVDVPALVRWALEPYAPAVLEALVPGAASRLDRSKVPPGRAVAHHLRPAGGSSVDLGPGVRIDAVTPIGLPLVGAIVCRALAGGTAGPRPPPAPRSAAEERPHEDPF